MDTLFIDRAETRLDTEAGRLIIRVPEERPANLPLKQLRFIVLSSRVSLSTTVLLAFAEHGISLTVVNPRRMQSRITCCGPDHGNVVRRIDQVRLYLDGEQRPELVRRLLSAKLLGQYRALLRHLRRRPDQRHSLTTALRQVRTRRAALATATDISAMRGIEGAAASSYFSALTTLFAASWEFTGRNRRPPRDPVNAILSLTYTLIHAEAVHALAGLGLDPSLGMLHDPYYNRDSLACDLVELMRASCDSWVVDLFRRQTLRAHHFQYSSNGACLLDKAGRALFYPAYHQALRQWRQRLRATAADWSRLLTALPEQGESSQ